ncbi:unnamed protein product, partial [Ectocarpus sp. 12 AP-2014]
PAGPEPFPAGGAEVTKTSATAVAILRATGAAALRAPRPTSRRTADAAAVHPAVHVVVASQGGRSPAPAAAASVVAAIARSGVVAGIIALRNPVRGRHAYVSRVVVVIAAAAAAAAPPAVAVPLASTAAAARLVPRFAAHNVRRRLPPSSSVLWRWGVTGIPGRRGSPQP